MKMDGKVWYKSPDGTLEVAFLSQKRVEEAMDLLEKSYINHENVSVTFGIPNDHLAKQDLKNLCKEAIQDGISMIAIDKTEQSDGKIVGVIINKIQENKEGPTFFDRHAALCKSQNSRDYIQFIIDFESKCNLFETLKIDCLAEIVFLGVDPEYRHNHIGFLLGIATIENIFFLYCGLTIPERSIPHGPIPKAISFMYSSKYVQQLWKYVPNTEDTVFIEIPFRDLYRNGRSFDETIDTKIHDSIGIFYLDFATVTEEHFAVDSNIGLAKPEYLERARKIFFGKSLKSHL